MLHESTHESTHESSHESIPGETPVSLETRIGLLEEVIERQRDAIEALRAEVATHRRGQEQHEQNEQWEQEEQDELEEESAHRRLLHSQRPAQTSRRKLLQLGGAAAVATVAAGVLATEGGTGVARAAGSVSPATLSSITPTLPESANGGVSFCAIEGDGTNGSYGVIGASDTNIGVLGYIPFGNASNSIAMYGVNNGGGTGAQGFGNPGVRGVTAGLNTKAVIGDATSATGINNTGVYGISTAGFGIWGISTNSWGVIGATTNGTGALLGDATGSTSGIGVVGAAAGGNGVRGTSQDGAALAGISTNWTGGYFSGPEAQIELVPNGRTGAPSSGIHYHGMLYVDSAATLWFCTATGTPGTWVRLTGVHNGVSGGAINFLANPIRLLDTRTGLGVFTAGSTHALQVTGVAIGGISVPNGAVGVVGNVTVVSPTAGGDLRLYPGATAPGTSSINFASGQTIANGVTVALNGSGRLNIHVDMPSSTHTHVLFDASGYIL